MKKVLLAVLILLTILPLSSCDEKVEKEEKLKVGMVVGGIFDQYIPDIFSDSEIEYFYSASDLPLALQSKKIDLYVDDEFSAKEHCKVYGGQKIDKIIADDNYGFIVNSNRIDLKKQIDSFINEIKADGRLEEIEDIWLNGDDEFLKDINYDELSDINGVIKVGIAATMPPIDYVKNGKYVGYEPAILAAFCKEYGYGIEFQNADFSSTMASVTSGTVDIGSASYSITEERKKNMLFTEPTMVAHCVTVVRDENATNTEINIVNERIGVVTGALFDVAVKEDDPTAIVEYYNYTSDLPIALINKKIDGYTADEPVARMLCNIYEDHVIVKRLTNEKYGVVINKNRTDLQEKFNEYISSMESTGDLIKLQRIWTGTNEEVKKIDFDSLSEYKEKITLATNSSMQPFDYIKDGKYAGYEIALIADFCKKYGYGLEIVDSNFTGVLAAVSTGKADFGTCVITITDERKDTMNFSNPIYEGGIVLVQERHNDSLDILKGKNIGIQTGSVYDQYIHERIENSNVEYFNMVSDMRAALDSNKISSFVVDSPVAELFINEYSNNYRILGTLHDVKYGLAMPKNKDGNEQLHMQLDNFVSKLKQSGELEEIYNVWIGNDNSKKVIDYDSLPIDGEKIVLATATTVGAPFIYKENHQILGYEADLICRFCKEYGYSLEIVDYSLDGLMTTLAAGKCNIAICGISITNERKETLYFVDEQLNGGCVVLVKNDSALITETSSNGIVDSFNKTFIREDRWKLFLSGIFTTIVIAAFSIIFGTILGFGVYMLYRNSNIVGRKIIDFIRNLLLKTPTVVVLMIIYYLIFGKSDISGSVVSIIGLSILFANSVMGLLIIGVNSIDKGQMEAAYMLGYSKNKAFIEIVMPQAILAVLSGYKSDVITLIKESAIVGYIAVQDLTKVSDIIRSRTYEAFFPLIATAIIYYVIASLFIYLLSKLEFRIDPKKRKSIPLLKGVKTNDKD